MNLEIKAPLHVNPFLLILRCVTLYNKLNLQDVFTHLHTASFILRDAADAHKFGSWLETLTGRLQAEVVPTVSKHAKLINISTMYVQFIAFTSKILGINFKKIVINFCNLSV